MSLSMESCLERYFPTGSALHPDAHALLDVPCAKVILSKALGTGIVAGSMLVKVPQIVKIVRAQSVLGLSPVALNLDLLAALCSVSYYAALGYNFLTWGENAFLLAQRRTSENTLPTLFCLLFFWQHLETLFPHCFVCSRFPHILSEANSLPIVVNRPTPPICQRDMCVCVFPTLVARGSVESVQQA